MVHDPWNPPWLTAERAADPWHPPWTLQHTGRPHPTDLVSPKLAVAHRSDSIMNELRHAAERLNVAASSPPGHKRDGDVAALNYHVREALDHAHRLVGVMKDAYPAEAKEYDALVGAMQDGHRSASAAPAVSFAHLAETICYHLAHASRHIASMAAGGPPELFRFDADHAGRHITGAIEHAGKFQQNLLDSYPVEGKWLKGLEQPPPLGGLDDDGVKGPGAMVPGLDK